MTVNSQQHFDKLPQDFALNDLLKAGQGVYNHWPIHSA